jgi:hypothetical protein
MGSISFYDGGMGKGWGKVIKLNNNNKEEDGEYLFENRQGKEIEGWERFV